MNKKILSFLLALFLVMGLSVNITFASEAVANSNKSYSTLGERTFDTETRQSKLTNVSLMALNDNAIYIDGTKVNLSYLEFYESDYEGYDEKVYRNMFAQTDARYINYEVGLSFKPPGHEIDFQLKAIYYYPDGSNYEQTFMAQIKSDWNGSNHSWGRGWDSPGNWKKGSYKVEIYINDQIMATGNFIIGDYSDYSGYHYFLKGEKAFYENNYEEALFYLNKSISMKQNNLDYYDAYQYKVHCLIELGKFSDAIQTINTIINLYGNSRNIKNRGI